MEKPIDWTCFKKRIHIQRSKEEIYASWLTRTQMESWFLEEAHFFDPKGNLREGEELALTGDHFKWKWNNWDTEEKGEILEANGADRISFTFGPGGKVHIDLTKSPYGTELLLEQKQIPTDEKSKMEVFVGCSTGWTFWLANLKAYLEIGVTLHAKGLSKEETNNLVNS